MKSKKIICCVLSAFLMLGTVFTSACKKKEEDEKTSNSYTSTDYVYNLSHTIHGGKVQATNESIVKNGVNNGYALVKSTSASAAENTAVALFREFFNKATGINLPVLEIGANAEWSQDMKIISFGSNTYQAKAQVTFDKKELTKSGFRLKTVGNSVFCVGGTLGIKYSAYELLKYYFGFEYYAPECYDLQTSVTDLPFYEFDIKERPDIEYISPTAGILNNSTDPYYRDGLRVSGGIPLVGYNNHPWHNTFDYIPFEEYGETHREWFADGQGNSPEQLCYSRDPDGMVPIVVDKMKELLLEKTGTELVTFVQQDCGAFCQCDSCKELGRKYGSENAGKAAGLLLFLNKVAKEIDEWVNSEEDPCNGRNIRIVHMAYIDTLTPPITKNDDGSYSLIDGLKCADNMVVIVAASGVKYLPFEDSGNQELWDAISGWAQLCDEMMFWQYPVDYRNYLFFFDTFSAQQKNFQKMVESHAIWLFDQGQYNTLNNSGFEILRAYLSCKLAYNCQIDYEQAVANFFNAYFGPAQTAMRQMFDGFRNRWAYLYSIGQAGQSSYDFSLEKYFPYGTIVQFSGYIDQAYEALEVMKTTNSEQYKRYKDRVNLESLSIRFTLLDRYESRMTPAEFLEMALEFKKDAMYFNIEQSGESRKLSTKYEQWGIA